MKFEPLSVITVQAPVAGTTTFNSLSAPTATWRDQAGFIMSVLHTSGSFAAHIQHSTSTDPATFVSVGTYPIVVSTGVGTVQCLPIDVRDLEDHVRFRIINQAAGAGIVANIGCTAITIVE